jgi:hypothetical protein
MTPSNPIRFTQALALAVIVFALAAPAVALGSSNQSTSSRDWFERYAAAHPFGHGLAGSTPAPDVFERYAATHATTVLTDGRSPDTRDAAEAARLRLAGGPSQETLIAASGSQPTGIVRPGGFDWGDASLGAGAALGLILLVGAAGYTLRHRGRVLMS